MYGYFTYLQIYKSSSDITELSLFHHVYTLSPYVCTKPLSYKYYLAVQIRYILFQLNNRIKI